MKITILTLGSRGDVEPLVALGEGLRESGHQVTIATEARFESFIRERGLDFAVIPGDTYSALNSEAGQRILNRKNNTAAFFKHLQEASVPFSKQIIVQSLEACRGADHVICVPVCLCIGFFISKELAIPLTVAAGNATVLCETKEFHNLMFPAPASWWPRMIQRAYNVSTFKIMHDLIWKAHVNMFAPAWKEITGEKLRANPLTGDLQKKRPLILLGYSPTILPKPKDWKDNLCVTGYWFLKRSANWKPLKELEDFTHSGPAPIYIGFGSMNSSLSHNGAIEQILLETITRVKCRAIILKQGLNLDVGSLSSDIYLTDPIPFEYLFPKMSLLVHHGGAGTTALGLRAGIPSVFTPLIVDQRFWSWRVKLLGAAAKPIYWHELSAAKIAAAISYTLATPSIRQNTIKLKEQISKENGVESAVSIFNRSSLFK